MPKWIRVRDANTGHQFDIDARVLKHRRGVEPVNDPERWPDLEGPRVGPRPAKPFVGKGGEAATPARFMVNEPSEGDELFIPRTDVQAQSTDDARQDAPSDGGRTRRSKTTSDPADAPTDTNAPKEQPQ